MAGTRSKGKKKDKNPHKAPQKRGPKFGGKDREIQKQALEKLFEDIDSSEKKHGLIKQKIEEYRRMNGWITRSMFNYHHDLWKKKKRRESVETAATEAESLEGSTDGTEIAIAPKLSKPAGRPKGTTEAAKVASEDLKEKSSFRRSQGEMCSYHMARTSFHRKRSVR